MRQSLMCMACAAGLVSVAQADFSGPYAPEFWTFQANGGDGFFDFSGAPAALKLVGNDNGVAMINTDITAKVVADGLWSFDWSKVPTDEGTYDSAWYLVNNQQFFIGFNNPPHSGSVKEIAVSAGDVIGFRVFSYDGVFGPLTLGITNFEAPVPAPSALGLLALAGVASCRRRRAGRGVGEKRGARRR